MNALEMSEKYLKNALDIIDRNEQDKEGRHHGIIYRVNGY